MSGPVDSLSVYAGLLLKVGSVFWLNSTSLEMLHIQCHSNPSEFQSSGITIQGNVSHESFSLLYYVWF